MRDDYFGATVLQVVLTAAALIFTVMLSGCASKSARNNSSHFNGDIRTAKLLAPRPVPAVRGYAKRSEPISRSPVLMNDEARYSAIYGVAPRPSYLRNPADETVVMTEPDPLPRRVASAETRRPIGANSRQFKTIIVTRGDTLHNLAWRYKTTVRALVNANGLAHANLEIGQELRVPVRG